MRVIPKRERLRDVGLKAYLNKTKDQHDNKGYDDFVGMLTSDLKYTKAQIAIAFGVNRDTIYQWLAVYNKEVDNG